MSDNETTDPLAQYLEAGRPVPRAAFRGDLRRALLAQARRTPAAPPRLRLIVAAYGASGLALLAVAAIGLTGAGPFAA